jgi:hypothetical protein
MTKPETVEEITGETQGGIRSPLEASMSATRMDYMADLLLELKGMAASEGHTTLAGILALAHAEAITKAR